MAHFVSYYRDARAHACLCRAGCTCVLLDLYVTSLPWGMADRNEELRDKLTQRGSKDPALPPWVIRDCFTILDFAGCMVPAHHPPMDWDTPQGLPRAAAITPNRLVAGLVCVHQYLEDQTEAGKLQK